MKYFAVPSAIMRNRSLSLAAKSIYALLCCFSGGADVYVGVQSIYDILNICPIAYQNAVRMLIGSGYLSVSQYNNGRYGQNIYSLIGYDNLIDGGFGKIHIDVIFSNVLDVKAKAIYAYRCCFSDNFNLSPDVFMNELDISRYSYRKYTRILKDVKLMDERGFLHRTPSEKLSKSAMEKPKLKKVKIDGGNNNSGGSLTGNADEQALPLKAAGTVIENKSDENKSSHISPFNHKYAVYYSGVAASSSGRKSSYAYNFQKLKNQIDYDYFTDEVPQYLDSADIILDLLAEAAAKDCIRVGKRTYSTGLLKRCAESLSEDVIVSFLDRYTKLDLSHVKIPKLHMLTSFIREIYDDQFKLDNYKNSGNKKEACGKRTKPLKNYEKYRSYDIDSFERIQFKTKDMCISV